MVPLFTVICYRENQATVTACLKAVNDSMIQVTGEPLNPKIIISDEASALKNGFATTVGNTDSYYYFTCQKHFRDSVEKKGKSLKPDERQKFANLCDVWLKAATPDEFDQLSHEIAKWIEEKSHRSQHLLAWFNWWEVRKCGWTDAYRITGISKSNLQVRTNKY